MNILLIILAFNFIGSIVSFLGGIMLLFHRNFAYKISHYLSSFAAGALLGAVFFDLLPEAISEAKNLDIPLDNVFISILFGILVFFVLERLLHWFHHHGFEDHELKGKPVIPLLLIGDTLHNFVDGIAIATTFIVSIPLGIVTTFAVGAHEIPQEIGDFGVMVKYGFSRRKIIVFNVISALFSFGGVFGAFYFGKTIYGLTPIMLSTTAGFFLYIALSDLIPEIHHDNKKGLAFFETVSLVIGVLCIYLSLSIIKAITGIS